VERVTRHPEVSAKLTAEARAGTSADYAHAVSTETLRLRPPVIGGGGTALRDFDLAEYRVRAGTSVMIAFSALHHDPDLYPQPERFRPERFLEHPPELFGWLPFGAGHHRCPGMHLALLESDLTLQRVFGRLTLEPVGKPERSSVRASFLNQPVHGARVVVTQRRAADEVPVYRPGREGCPDGGVGQDACPVTVSDGEG
jgi:cytochrome P450